MSAEPPLPRDVAGALSAVMQEVASGSASPEKMGDMIAQLRERVRAALDLVRTSRAELQQNGVSHLHAAHAKLTQVTSATEQATTSIMDALDRAQQHVDTIATSNAGVPPEPVAALRDELFTVMTELQFQDITSQMLAHAGSMLQELEAQLVSIAALLDGGTAVALEAALPPADPQAFDPNATIANAEDRQALADAAVRALVDPPVPPATPR